VSADTTLRGRLAAALEAADGHSCMYQEGADYADMADALLPLFAAEREAVLREVLAAVEDPTRRQHAAAHFNMGSGLGWESARDVIRLMLDPSADATGEQA
jgi:hypothetical protein